MRLCLSYICSLFAVLICACSNKTASIDGSPILAIVGNEQLTRNLLAKALPIGLNSADSAVYAKNYIRHWIDSRIISEIASSEIDMTDINRMVSDYRNKLVELEYRRRMSESYVPDNFPDDSLRNYYIEHNSEFILDAPLLRGLYLKVPDNSPNLSVIRRLYRSDRQNDIDRLEKEVLTSAIHYDYFRDKWIPWNQIEIRIPFDFGSNPDAFLKGKDHVEISAGGFVYFLDITDVLPTGSITPFETAKQMISERFAAGQRKSYDRQLMDQLFKKSLKERKIQLFVDLES